MALSGYHSEAIMWHQLCGRAHNVLCQELDMELVSLTVPLSPCDFRKTTPWALTS